MAVHTVALPWWICKLQDNKLSVQAPQLGRISQLLSQLKAKDKELDMLQAVLRSSSAELQRLRGAQKLHTWRFPP